MTTKDQEKRIKAINALQFLQNHPAISTEATGNTLFDGAWMHMAKCCKRGICESAKNMLTVYRGDKNWENVKYKFDKLEKKYAKVNDDIPKEFYSVYVKYSELYKEPWKFDHVEYWYETTFYIYEGNPYDRMECLDYKKWDGFSGPEGGANTFEDMIVEQASKVKKIYGNFDKEKDFRLEAEIKNHKENEMFHKFDTEKGRLCLDRNLEYLDVTVGMINLRWWQWFVHTDYCKEHWGDSIDRVYKIIERMDDKMPAKRKKIIEKYS